MEKSGNPPPYTDNLYPPPLPPQTQGPQTTVVVGGIPSSSTTFTAVVVGQASNYGPATQNAICPHCHAQILTRVEAETTSRTHLYALILCLVGCWPCACIPYCVDSCKSAHHYCPNCGSFLGVYKR